MEQGKEKAQVIVEVQPQEVVQVLVRKTIVQVVVIQEAIHVLVQVLVQAVVVYEAEAVN